MVPSGFPSTFGQSGDGSQGAGTGFSSYQNGPNSFSTFGVAQPSFGFYPSTHGGFSAPSTHGGWPCNGVSSNFSFPGQTRVPNTSNETTPWGNSTTPVSGEEKPISISAKPAYSNKSHEELRLEHYNAWRRVQPNTSGATSKGLGPTISGGGSLFQKPEPVGAETFVDLLKSTLSTNNFPIGIGFAGQFPPDTLVLCQLKSSTSVDPNGAVSQSKVPSSYTPAVGFPCPEPGINTASLKTLNAPETLAKMSGQIKEEIKSGVRNLYGELPPPYPVPLFSANPFTFQRGTPSTPCPVTCPAPEPQLTEETLKSASSPSPFIDACTLSKSETVGKSDDVNQAKDGSGSSAKLKLNISVPLDAFELDEIEAMMPKIQSLDYYTIPSVQELVEKELIEPGFCSRVKDFVVGRRDYGCIKFLGETDVRNLDLESLIKFDTMELTLFEGDVEKPEAGQGLNKPSEVTLLNVKCTDKGKECVDGPKVDRFRQILIRKAASSGVEFVSYDAAAGEWKFKVQQF